MSTPFDPQPCDGGGGGTAGNDTELEILCDANGTPFLRQYLYSPLGAFLGAVDTALDGLTPFVPVAPVGDCFATGGGGTVPTPAQLRNQDSFILCDDNGTQFIRWFVRDGAGAVQSTNDTTLNGSTPFAPVAPVGLCPSAITGTVTLDEPVTVDGNVGVTGTVGITGPVSVTGGPVSVTGSVGITGQPIATTTTITGQPISVTGTVGISGQPLSVTISGQPISVTGTVGISGPVTVTGSVTIAGQPVAVTISGQPIAVTGTVSANATLVTPVVSAQHFDVLPGGPWTPAGQVAGTLTSLSYTVLSGTATVVDSNGTSIATIPTGYSATWDNGIEGTLTGPQSIASVGGRVLVVWSEK